MYQDPQAGAPVPTPAADPQTFLQQLELIGWVDRTALAVLLVFFVIGLFKGLIWQVSRIAILAVAYLVAGRFGPTVGEWFGRPAEALPSGAPADTPETTLYLAYVLLFLAVLVALSLAAMLVQKLAARAGLGFFDRLGGGVLGVATGSCLVLFGLFVVHMFFQGSALAHAAGSSHSLRLSQKAIAALGGAVPDELRKVLALPPLQPADPADPVPVPPADPAAPVDPARPRR